MCHCLPAVRVTLNGAMHGNANNGEDGKELALATESIEIEARVNAKLGEWPLKSANNGENVPKKRTLGSALGKVLQH